MQPSLRLAELLCARLCHELASPLSTLAGVMEMLTEGSASAAEARGIATEAATTVRARLRLLRAAWSNDCGAMTTDDIRSMTAGLRISRKVVVNMEGLTGEFSGAQARLLLNIMLVAVEALGGNGSLMVIGSPAGVQVALSGPRAEWPQAFVDGVADEEAAWNALSEPRDMQAPLAAIVAHGTGYCVTFERVENGCLLNICFA